MPDLTPEQLRLRSKMAGKLNSSVQRNKSKPLLIRPPDGSTPFYIDGHGNITSQHSENNHP
jgi:hypothetical protein